MSIVSVGEQKRLSLWPGASLKGFGTNPYDEPMYRIVWSESRTYMVGGNHTDYDESAGGPSKDSVVRQRGNDPNAIRTQSGYRYLPLYPGVKAWVLEHWQSAFQFTGMSPERYESAYRDISTGLLTLGPYPERGEYVQCHIFAEGLNIGWSVVCDIIGLIEAGRAHTFAQKKAAWAKKLEMEEKQRRQQTGDWFRDRQRVGGIRPANIKASNKSQQHIPQKLTAQQAGLPRPHRGLSAGLPRPQHV